MNPIAQEFLDKAIADRATAERELAVTMRPNFDAVCFHAQQAIEKFMKAVILEAGGTFPKTHDLTALTLLIQQAWPRFTPAAHDMSLLQPGAVDYRYPGQSADRQDATDAVDACRRVGSLLCALIPGMTW